MATLDRRLTALETKANLGGVKLKTLIVTFLTPGDTEPDIRNLRQWVQGAEAREWVRGAGESEQDFKDRASRESTRNALGLALLLQCD